MKNLSKTEWLLIFHILKRKENSVDTEFVLFNPLTYLYMTGSLIHLSFLYLKYGKNFQL